MNLVEEFIKEMSVASSGAMEFAPENIVTLEENVDHDAYEKNLKARQKDRVKNYKEWEPQDDEYEYISPKGYGGRHKGGPIDKQIFETILEEN